MWRDGGRTLAKLALATSPRGGAWRIIGRVAALALACLAAQPAAAQPSVNNVTDTSAILNMPGGDQNWAFQQHLSAGCTLVFGSTLYTVTDLTENTSYRYNFHSAYPCTSATFIGQASFTTLSLTASDLSRTGAKLTLANYSGNWHHQRTGPDNGTCSTAITGTEATLSGLTPATNYTWKAYRDSSCTTAIATETFTTLHELKATQITKTTARLTIKNRTGNWHHKRTSPSVGNCSAAISASTADIGSLTAGTRYTWKAYSDSGCSAVIGSVDFTAASDSKPTITLAPTPGYIMESAPNGTAPVYVKMTASKSLTAKGCLHYEIVRGTASAADIGATNLDTPFKACIESGQTVGWGTADHSLSPTSDSTDEDPETLLVELHSHDGTLDGSPVKEGTLYLHDGRRELVVRQLTSAGFFGIPEPGGTSRFDMVFYAKHDPTGSYRFPGTFETSIGSITVARSGGTATSGTDYETISDISVDIIGGYQGVGTEVAITAKDDSTVEGMETIEFTPSMATNPISLTEKRPNGTTLSMGTLQLDLPNKWSINILDDENATYTFTLSASTIAESGTSTNLTATVRRSDGTNFKSNRSGTLRVGTTVDGASSSDYSASYARTVNLTAGHASASYSITLSPTPDEIAEGDESINVIIQFGSDVLVASLTITDDDSGLTLSKTWLSVTEGSNAGTYTIRPTKRPSGNVSISLVSSDTDAATVSPATLSFTTWNWNTPKTVTVTPVDDNDASNESVTITHTASGGGYSEAATMPVTVADDDSVTLSASNIKETTATLTIGYYNASWHHERATPTGGTCSSAVSGTTANLTGLTGGIAYTWKAYSDSGCKTEIASETFTTVSLVAETVYQTQARLKISNWSGDWWVEGEQSGAECTKGNTATGKVQFASLTADTSYTYAAYSASGCASANKIADVTFKTWPPIELSSSSVSTTSATLNLKHWGGSGWRYKGSQSNASCVLDSDSGTTKTADLSGLTANTSYTYKAYSSRNTSCDDDEDLLATHSFTTLPPKPSTPTIGKAGSGALALASTVGGGSAALTKWQYVKKEGANAFEATWTDIGSTAKTLSHTVTGLTNGTSYEFKVRAVNAGGESAESDASAATIPAVPTLTATVLSKSGATLTIGNWDIAWWYEGSQTDAPCVAVAAGTNSATLSGLDASTTYTYKAYSKAGCSASDEIEDVAFTTWGEPSLRIENIGIEGATMTLRYWPAGTPWSYRLTSVRGSGCVDSRRPSHPIHVELVGLWAATLQTVTAYQGAGCNSANLLDTATFTTRAADWVRPSLSVNHITNTSAVLTLAGHAGDWWYAETATRDVCTKVSAGTQSVTLSGLTPNQYYGYVAESQSCDLETPVDWITEIVEFTTSGPISITISGKTDGSLTLTVGGITSGNWSCHTVETYLDHQDAWGRCVTQPYTTTSDTATGLKRGTHYTVHVYRGNSCAFVDNRVTAATHTLNLSAESVGENSATLKLDHHTGNWWHKEAEQAVGGRRAPSGGLSGASGQIRGSGASCTAAGSGSSADLSNLNPGTSYAWNAYSTDDCAVNTKIASTEFTTQGTPVQLVPPAAPTGLAATAGDQSVTLTWNDPSDSSITRYEYNVNHNATSTGNFTGWGAWVAIPGSGANTTSHLVTGLVNGREYRFHVRAVNADGIGAQAPNAHPWFVSATPRQAPPAAPTGLAATAGDQSVTLSWNDPSDPSITHYEYNVNHNATSTGNFTGWGPWTAIDGSSASTTSHTLTGLANGREYRFHLRAVSVHGAGAQAPDAHPWFVSATPEEPSASEPPATPTSVSVTRGDGTLTATWPAVEGATSYWVTYSDDYAVSWERAALNHPTNSITIDGVDNAKTYIVAVMARNEHGDSGWRNSPPAPPFTGVAAVSLVEGASGHLSNLSTLPTGRHGDAVVVPLVPSGADAHLRSGLVRIANHSDRAGGVRIEAFDDTDWAYAALTLTMGGNGRVVLTTDDLEFGNVAKGLAGALGPATAGHWRLRLVSDLNIEALAYVRHADGFVTSMHDFAPQVDGVHLVATLPAQTDAGQSGLLRLVNVGATLAQARIVGIDDRGLSSESAVLADIPAHRTLTLAAEELQQGGDDFVGALGTGEGMWRLQVTSEQAIRVMALSEGASGHLANLSSAPANRHRSGVFVPLLLVAGDPYGREGLVRIVNASPRTGSVRIEATDDGGWAAPPLTLALGSGAATTLTSADIEFGNAAKGLAGATGLTTTGHWHLNLTSNVDIQALAYTRHRDGLLTAMHDTAPIRNGIHCLATFLTTTNAPGALTSWRLLSLLQNPTTAMLGNADGTLWSPDRPVTVPPSHTVTLTP